MTCKVACKSPVLQSNTCNGEGLQTVAGVPNVYCNAEGRALIQRNSVSCSTYGELESVDTSSCGYISGTNLGFLAKNAEGVFLQDVAAGTATSTCGAVDALQNRLGWHDTRAQWTTTGNFCFGEATHPLGCPISEVFEWPNMYCSPSATCAHWQASTRHSATEQLSTGSETWLDMRPAGNPSICATLASLPGSPNDFIYCDAAGNSFVKTQKPVSACSNDNIGITVPIPGTTLVCKLYPTVVTRGTQRTSGRTSSSRRSSSSARSGRSTARSVAEDDEMENHHDEMEYQEMSNEDEFSLTTVVVSAAVAAVISLLVGVALACLFWTKLAKKKNAARVPHKVMPTSSLRA